MVPRLLSAVAAIGREAALKQAGGLAGAKIAESARFTLEDRQLLVAFSSRAESAQEWLAASTQAPISILAFISELIRTTEPPLMPLMIVIAEANLTYRRFESKTTY